VLAHFLDGSRELYTTAFTAATGVNLRFHHPHGASELTRCFYRLIDAKARQTAWSRHAELTEDFLSLVFVDLHRGPL
jgi:hypothetical protein